MSARQAAQELRLESRRLLASRCAACAAAWFLLGWLAVNVSLHRWPPGIPGLLLVALPILAVGAAVFALRRPVVLPMLLALLQLGCGGFLAAIVGERMSRRFFLDDPPDQIFSLALGAIGLANLVLGITVLLGTPRRLRNLAADDSADSPPHLPMGARDKAALFWASLPAAVVGALLAWAGVR